MENDDVSNDDCLSGPKSAADAVKLRAAVAKLMPVYRNLSLDQDAEMGQLILCGTSETQLDEVIDILRENYGIDSVFGRKQVAYFETLGANAELQYTHKRQAGGSGQYVEVTILFEPARRNAGVAFEDRSAGAVPLAYVAYVEKGVRVQAKTGVRAGFPTVDFKATLTDGKYHDVDSSALAFEIAAKACFRKLGQTEAPRIIEPIMNVRIIAPRQDAKAILDDLKKRRGRIDNTEMRGLGEVITASVPPATMFGDADDLRVLSQDQAQFSMRYVSHEEVPPSKPPDGRFPPAKAMRA